MTVADNRRTLLSWFWPPPSIAARLWIAVAAATAYSVFVWWLHPPGNMLQPLWTSQFALWNTAILGLLISFRTKVAYDRWWEGRILWGALVNHSRNICLKVREFVAPDPAERAAVAGLVAGFAVALMRHLRGPLKLTEVPGFEKQTAEPGHVPAHLAGELMRAAVRWRAGGRIDGHTHQILDTNLNALMDICGACERIRNTPLAPSYLSLLRHGLVLGLLVTPWAMLPSLDAWVIVLLPVMVYFLFGIELTAEAVEQPFGADGDDLALETYCETIRKSANDILAV